MLSLVSVFVCWNHPHAVSTLPSLSFLMYFISGGCHLLPSPFFYFLFFLVCSFPPLLYIIGLVLRAWMHLAASNRKPPQAGLAGMEMYPVTQKEVGSFVAQPAIKTPVHSISPLLSAGLSFEWKERTCHLATEAKCFLVRDQVWIDIDRERIHKPESFLMASPKSVA